MVFRRGHRGKGDGVRSQGAQYDTTRREAARSLPPSRIHHEHLHVRLFRMQINIDMEGRVHAPELIA